MIAQQGYGPRRLTDTPSPYIASGIGAGVIADEPVYTSEYDTYNTVVITHKPTDRVFTVEMERFYDARGRGLRDRIVRLQEGYKQMLMPWYRTWCEIDLDTPALADWYEADYETPEELVEACQDMLTLIIAGGAG